MARIRGSARLASRHTGDLYGTGYQYEYPDPIQPIVLGGWERVWPLGDRDVPSNTLQSLKNGVLIDGVIYPLWGLTETNTATRTIVGAYTTYNVGTQYRVVFYIDGADANKLKIEIYDGNSTVTTDTLLTPGASIRICAAAWQNYIYFGWDGATTLHRVDTAGTYSTVAGSPANAEFLFVLDNNLVAIYKSGNSYVTKWAVDSDPTDWSGSGSGSSVIDGALGRPQGVGQYKQDAIIICLSGGLQMSATGSASPAFRFIKLDNISGCPWTHAVVGTGSAIYYFTQHRRLFAYDGQEKEVGVGEKTFEKQPTLAFSKLMNLIIVSDYTNAETLFMNPAVHEWVSDYDKGWNWIVDSPETNAIGHIIGYYNKSSDTSVDTYDFDLSPVAYETPSFSTGRYYMGREVWIDHVDVIRTTESAPQAPALRLRRQLRDGFLENKDYGAASGTGVNSGGTTIRYYISGPAELLELTFSKDIAGKMPGPWLLDSMNAAGNVPVDISNPSAGYRGDASAGGNASVTSTATTYYGDTINSSGNMVLLTSSDLWTKNVGIDRIIIYGKELRRGSPTAT